MYRHRVFILFALLFGCSNVKDPAAESTSQGGASDDDADADATSKAVESDDADASSEGLVDEDDSPILDEWDQLPETETDSGTETDESTDGATTDGEEGNVPEAEMPACCFCVDEETPECAAWVDSEAACYYWGFDQGVFTAFDPDCPEAWTPDFADDVACVVTCE
jgi:hypothetical protein